MDLNLDYKKIHYLPRTPDKMIDAAVEAKQDLSSALVLLGLLREEPKYIETKVMQEKISELLFKYTNKPEK